MLKTHQVAPQGLLCFQQLHEPMVDTKTLNRHSRTQKDGRMDGWTDPLIKIQGHILEGCQFCDKEMHQWNEGPTVRHSL